MRDWLISVPVWGRQYIHTFVDRALPALWAAMIDLGERCTLVVHTNSAGLILENTSNMVSQSGGLIDVVTVPIDPQPTYVTLQKAHADAIGRAKLDQPVVLLNADLVVSGNLLRRCREHFDAGKMAVVLMGIRTDPRDEATPVAAAPRDLLAWAWAHRHQIIRDIEWETGTSLLPTNLFFSEGPNVVARGFHLHPVAIMKHKEFAFQSTIDGDLLEHFDRGDIHVVTDLDDLAMLEVSEASRRFPVSRGRAQGFTPKSVALSMRRRSSDLHRWLFTHRIAIQGAADGIRSDIAPCEAILVQLAKLGAARF